MNTIFLGFLSLLIINSAAGILPKGVHYLNWITHQTQWPVVLRKTTENSDSEFGWFRYDQKCYVSDMPNYKGNYFVSKEQHGSDLTIFKYNSKTHEQLTTYEPIQKTDFGKKFYVCFLFIRSKDSFLF
jgi:hypothetical protein